MDNIKIIIDDITRIIHNIINDITLDSNNAPNNTSDKTSDKTSNGTLFLVINTRIYTDICGIFDTYEKAYECLLEMGGSADMIIYKMKLNETIYDFYLNNNKNPTILYTRQR